MNIRSIDLQVLIPRATEASKVQQIANHQSVLEQQQFADQIQTLAKDRQRQVQNSPKSEGGKIHNKEREKGQQQTNDQQEQSSNKQEESLELEEYIADPIKGHVIDIKT